MHVDLSQFHGKRVCVALSGGGDSIALFHYLKTHAAENGILLSALNIEHGIRGETSLRDTAFVKELCAREGVPLYCFSADIPALAAAGGRGGKWRRVSGGRNMPDSVDKAGDSGYNKGMERRFGNGKGEAEP